MFYVINQTQETVLYHILEKKKKKDRGGLGLKYANYLRTVFGNSVGKQRMEILGPSPNAGSGGWGVVVPCVHRGMKTLNG